MKPWPVVLIASLALSSCAGLNRPKIPPTLSPDTNKNAYTVDQFDQDYKAYKAKLAATPPDQAAARVLRDEMINRIRVEIEENYREYTAKLFTGRAIQATAGDVFELSLSTATAITKGERVKTILAAALTGVQGSRLSIDKNLFREKTTEVIMTQMDAGRNQIKNRILDQMQNFGVDQYPFEQAWVDLIEFFYAGTLQGGLQQLANEAGKQAAEARVKTEEILKQKIRTQGELADITLIREKFNELFNSRNRAAAVEALAALGVGIQGDTSDEEVFRLLNAKIRDASSPQELAALKRALKIP